MFWNISGILVSIALLTIFIVQTICSILKISFSIPTGVVNAIAVICWIATSKKYTEKVWRFTLICLFLSALLGFIQSAFL